MTGMKSGIKSIGLKVCATTNRVHPLAYQGVRLSLHARYKAYASTWNRCAVFFNLWKRDGFLAVPGFSSFSIPTFIRCSRLVEAQHFTMHVDHHLETRHTHIGTSFLWNAVLQERIELLLDIL